MHLEYLKNLHLFDQYCIIHIVFPQTFKKDNSI